MEETCHNNNQKKNETLDKEDAVAGPQLKCAYRRKGKARRVSQVSRGSELHTGERQVQASYNLFSQVTSRHQVMLCTLYLTSNLYLFMSIFYLFQNIHLHSSEY